MPPDALKTATPNPATETLRLPEVAGATSLSVPIAWMPVAWDFAYGVVPAGVQAVPQPAPTPAGSAGLALAAVPEASPTINTAPSGEPTDVTTNDPGLPAITPQILRLAEALIFASDRPVTPTRLGSVLPDGYDARAVAAALAEEWAGRGVQLAHIAGGYTFRTAADLKPELTRVIEAPRRLSRVAMETLAIIAWHQPATRAEIEELRGASVAQSTLDALLELALITTRGRKEVPGRPALWVTTPRFLEHFGLKGLSDLPKREELLDAAERPGLPLTQPTPPPAAPGTATATAEQAQ